MKDYLTMKEASLLLGKTTKTIKNYIKRGVIRNYFLVDGKYGQEYKISVRDLEPLGIELIDVLREDFAIEGKSAGEQEKSGQVPEENEAQRAQGSPLTTQVPDFISRYEQLVVELDKSRESVKNLTEELGRMKQDLEEKNMLIQVLMQKNGRSG